VIFQYLWAPVVILLVGYILLQITGKKFLAQMTSFDLLIIFVLGTIIAEPIVSHRLDVAAYFAVIIAIVYIAFSILVLNNNKFKNMLKTTPTVLIRNGDIEEQGLRKVKLTINELLAHLRQKGYMSPSNIVLALMEENGKISIIPMADHRPIRPSDLNMSPSPTFMPIPIIMDGEIINHNLKYIQKDLEWLTNQLKAYNISMDSLDKVTLATLNQKGFLDVDQNFKDRKQGIDHNLVDDQ